MCGISDVLAAWLFLYIQAALMTVRMVIYYSITNISGNVDNGIKEQIWWCSRFMHIHAAAMSVVPSTAIIVGAQLRIFLSFRPHIMCHIL